MMKIEYEKLSGLLALQAVVVILSTLALAFVINFPDWRNRPPFESIQFFVWVLFLSISFLIFIMSGQSMRKSGAFQWSKVAWAFIFLFLWWYATAFLLLNTYGS
jgi:hypothetical protein